MTANNFYFVEIITTARGGKTSSVEVGRFGSYRGALETADRLQAQFDADAEPKRTYILDSTRVPIAAGGEGTAVRRISQHTRKSERTSTWP
jgi:hypothetical protein